MAEDAKHRLAAAVEAVLERGELGETSSRRIRLAVAELIAKGETGRREVEAQISRAGDAVRSGRISEAVLAELVEPLMAGWSNAAGRGTKSTRHSSVVRHRNQPGRELRRVPEGTRVTYDGVWGTIRGGRIVLDDGLGTFDTPTPAARAITGQESINGWAVFRLADGRTLLEAYDAKRW